MERTVYTSAARTATPTAVTVRTGRYRGVKLFINVTAITATPSVVPTVDMVDSLSGAVKNLLTGAAITGTGQTVLTIYPGVTVAANVSAADVLPESIKITMIHGDADSITYTVAVHLIQ